MKPEEVIPFLEQRIAIHGYLQQFISEMFEGGTITGDAATAYSIFLAGCQTSDEYVLAQVKQNKDA